MKYYDFDRGYLGPRRPSQADCSVCGFTTNLSRWRRKTLPQWPRYNGSFSRINSFDNTSSRMAAERENVVYANLTNQITLSPQLLIRPEGRNILQDPRQGNRPPEPAAEQVPTSNFTFADLRAGTETNYADQGISFR